MKIPSISHQDKNNQTFLLLDMNYDCYRLNTKSTLILISKFFTQIKPWASWHGVYILMWVYILIYSLYYDLGFISDMTFVLTALWEIYKTRKHVAQTTSINIIVCAGYQHGFTYQDPPSTHSGLKTSNWTYSQNHNPFKIQISELCAIVDNWFVLKIIRYWNSEKLGACSFTQIVNNQYNKHTLL